MLRHQTIKNSQQRREAEHAAATAALIPRALVKGQLLPPRAGSQQSKLTTGVLEKPRILESSNLSASLIYAVLNIKGIEIIIKISLCNGSSSKKFMTVFTFH